MTDVVVVGGGPAGSVTAMLLAQQGYQVRLLERQHFPRPKPCGDCLSPGANRVLRRIGVWDDIMRAQPAHLGGWRLTSPSGVSFTSHFAEISCDPEAAEAIAITRDRFDHILLEHARTAGVNVHHGVQITDLLRARDGSVEGVRAQSAGTPITVKSRMTVGADGLRSVVARRLRAYSRRPRLRKTSFTLHVELPSTRELGEMRVMRNACLGTAPVQSGLGARLHNLTLVLNAGTYDQRAGVHQIVTNGLAAFGLMHVDWHASQILTSGPFDWPTRQTTFDGAALVGDAAGYYDPFTGQGIFQALCAAEQLAEHAARALRNRKVTRRDLRSFESAQRRLTQPARRVQRLIELVCAHPQLADQMFRKFAREQEVARTLVGVTADLLPAASLLSPRLLARLAR
jgi:flavin-dependent dehydrogenase